MAPFDFSLMRRSRSTPSPFRCSQDKQLPPIPTDNYASKRVNFCSIPLPIIAQQHQHGMIQALTIHSEPFDPSSPEPEFTLDRYLYIKRKKPGHFHGS